MGPSLRVSDFSKEGPQELAFLAFQGTRTLLVQGPPFITPNILEEDRGGVSDLSLNPGCIELGKPGQATSLLTYDTRTILHTARACFDCQSKIVSRPRPQQELGTRKRWLFLPPSGTPLRLTAIWTRHSRQASTWPQESWGGY